MPGTISESYLSRPFTLGKDAGRELVYDVRGTHDETEVRNLILSTAPPTYGGLLLESVSAEPAWADTETSQGIWKAKAKYVRFENDNEYTFDTGGGTTKITQSLATVASYARPGFAAPNFDGAMGVTEDRVEGTEIATPKFEFSETHRLADAAVTTAYKVALFHLTGRVNDAPFKGLAAGECLFLGASGTKRGDELWQLTFRFSGSANATGLTAGSITGIDKKGWEYLWVRYADFVDGPAFTLVKKPEAVYVERVYETGDFSTLGIGT